MEEVVLDPESLFEEVGNLEREKKRVYDYYLNFQERLPTLDQQLQERTLLLKHHEELRNNHIKTKAKENDIK